MRKPGNGNDLITSASMPSLTTGTTPIGGPSAAAATNGITSVTNSPSDTPNSPKRVRRRISMRCSFDESMHSEKTNESTLVSRENATHLAFSVTRRQQEFVFASSEQYFQVINDFCNFDDSLLAVLSESGNGKTALLANWASLRRQTEDGSHELIHEHYCGCSYDSVKLSSLLFRFMNHLKTALGLRDFELPLEHEEEKLKFSLARCLECAIAKSTSRSKRRNIILILDGIDCIRTEDGGDSLSWLPNVFPPGVKIIVSATLNARTKLLQCCKSIVRQPFAYDPDGDLIYESKLPPPELDSHSIRELKRKKATFLVVEPFDEPKCRELLALYEQRVGAARNALTDEIKLKIIHANGSSSPLYCRLVLQGLELFDRNDSKQQLRMVQWLDKVAVVEDLHNVYELLMKRWNEILLEDLMELQGRHFNSKKSNLNSTNNSSENGSNGNNNNGERSNASGTGSGSPVSLKSTPSDPDAIRRCVIEKRRASKRDLMSMFNSTGDTIVGGAGAGTGAGGGGADNNQSGPVIQPPNTPPGYEELEKLQVLLEQRALLARHTLSLLSVSRYGLGENDLFVLLGGTETMTTTNSDRVPRYLFEKLLWVLSPHLMRIYRRDCVEVQDPSNNVVIDMPQRVTLYAISHNQLQLVVRFGFLQHDELRFNYFRELANFFQGMSACQRRIEELPVQLERCTSWSVLQGILVDIRMFQLWWHERNRQEFLSYWIVLRNFCTIHDPVDDFIRSLDEFIIQENPSSEHLMALFLSITEFLRMWQKVEEAKNGANSSSNTGTNARSSGNSNTHANAKLGSSSGFGTGSNSGSGSNSAGSPGGGHGTTHGTMNSSGSNGSGGPQHRPGAQLNRPEPPQLQEFLTSLGTFSLTHFAEQESKRIKQEIDILSVHSDDGYHVRRWLWTQFPLIAVAFESRFLRNLVVTSRSSNGGEGRGSQKWAGGNNNDETLLQDQSTSGTTGATGQLESIRGAKSTTSSLPPTKGPAITRSGAVSLKSSNSPSPSKKQLAKPSHMFSSSSKSGNDAEGAGPLPGVEESVGSQILGGKALGVGSHNSTSLLGDTSDMSGGISVAKLESQLLEVRMQYDKLKFFTKEKKKMLKNLESDVFEARAQKEHEGKSFSLIETLNRQVHVANEETFVGRTRSDYYKSILRHCEVNPARDPNTIEHAEKLVNKLKNDIVELQQKSQLLWYERKLALVETPKLVEVIREKAKMHQTVIARLRWRQRLLQRKFVPLNRESTSRERLPPEASAVATSDNNNNNGSGAIGASNRAFRSFLNADVDEEAKTLSRVKDKMMHKITTALDRHRKVDSVKVYEGSEYKDDGILGILRHVGVNKPEEVQWYWQDQLDHAVQLEHEMHHAEHRVGELREKLALLQTQLLHLKLGTGVAIPAATTNATANATATTSENEPDKEGLIDPQAVAAGQNTGNESAPTETNIAASDLAVATAAGVPNMASQTATASLLLATQAESSKGHNIKQIEHQLNEATLVAQQKKERAVRMKNLCEKLHLGLLHLAQMLGVASASGLDSIALVDAIEQVVRLLLGDGAPLPSTSSNPSNSKYRGSARSVLMASSNASSALPTSRTAEERIKYNIRVDRAEHVKRKSLIDGIDDIQESSERRSATPSSDITEDDGGEEDDPVRKRLELKNRARTEAEKKRSGQRRTDKRNKPLTPGALVLTAAAGVIETQPVDS